jgi:hypothetical protein
LFKFGVSDAGLVRYYESLTAAGPGATGTYSKVSIPKWRAHVHEKYLRSLHYASTGQWYLDGMKIPYPHDLNTGKRLPKPLGIGVGKGTKTKIGID